MSDELGFEARALIEQALREEGAVDPVALERVRRRVLGGAVVVSILGASQPAAALTSKGLGVGLAAIMKAALLGAGGAALVVGLTTALKPSRSHPEALPRSALTDRGESTRATPAHESPRTAPTALGSTPQASTPQASTEAPAAPSAGGPLPAPRPANANVGGVAAVRAEATAVRNPNPKLAPKVDAPGAELAPASSLTLELALLERVQSKLRRGEGHAALELLDASAAPAGGGQLGAERLAAEVLAACAAHEPERARRAARAFFQAYPTAPASQRVRASCAGREGS
jgi:hypothetical protein